MSSEQLCRLIGFDLHRGSLLDVGAGDGYATSQISRHFSQVRIITAATTAQLYMHVDVCAAFWLVSADLLHRGVDSNVSLAPKAAICDWCSTDW